MLVEGTCVLTIETAATADFIRPMRWLLMTQHRGTVPNRTGILNVLSVSPQEDDHASLQRIVNHSNWTLFQANHLAAALKLLRQHDISVVLCEQDLNSATWLDLLDHLRELPNAPSLVVTSRSADERLWAEVLNLGAWDVLSKPFDRDEVLRSVGAAWRHWRNAAIAAEPKVMRAAS